MAILLMNNLLGQALLWATSLAAGAAGVTSVLAVWRLLRWRARDYEKKYREFLERDKREGEADHEDK